MLRRLHHYLVVACLALGAGTAWGQYPPPGGAYGSYRSQPTWPVHQGFPPQSYYGPAPGTAAEPDPEIITELLPPDRGLWWHTDEALTTAIMDTSHGAWFRLEYLNFDFDDPGNTLLGAPLAGIPNPNEPFDIITPGGAVVTGRVLNTSTVSFDNINGVKGSFGIPLAFGHVEGVLWGSAESTNRIRTDELPAVNPLQDVDVIVTSLLTNGVPGSSVILYDADFRALYSAQVFNAEANLYYNFRNPRLGLRILPAVGFRFFEYEEKLAQTGVYDNRSGINPGGILIDPLVRRINSYTDNDTFTLQTGYRFEFAHQLVTLGVEPKVGMGYNHYEAKVLTSDLRDSPYPPVVDDPLVITAETHDKLAVTADLQLYAKVHLSQWFHLRVGYNHTWLTTVARADSAIFYNDNGVGNPPAVRARGSDEWLGVSSVSVGGEIILP